jgi:inner membrane protein
MTSRTHNAIALASLVTVSVFYQPNSLNIVTLVGAVIGNNIGSLIPDMDTSGNYLWGLLPQGQKIGKLLRRIFYKHRTITHSLLGLLFIFEFFKWFLPKVFNSNFIDPNIILISIMIGFISHLIADSFTEEGIPLLFPLKITFGIPPIKKVRIKTGRGFENFVVFPAVWIYLFFIIQKNQNTFLEILKNVK